MALVTPARPPRNHPREEWGAAQAAAAEHATSPDDIPAWAAGGASR
ncbi:MAG TPA: hypothetical protein VMV07_18545 [Streptosporangiaceae bacterium]|nr:hypothetical protein [Streptosporangiaceae bacterium]